MAEIVLVRHGHTEWSKNGRHTSYTDLDLTPDGERQTTAMRPAFAGRSFAGVMSSPRTRSVRTAELAGLTVDGLDDDLSEWEYGEYEGLTTGEIRRTRPDWDIWRDGCPGGERPEQVGVRMDRVLDRVRATLSEGGDVALFGHGHALRVLAARWVGLAPGCGALLRLDAGTLCTLGYERARPVVLSWNVPVPDDSRTASTAPPSSAW